MIDEWRELWSLHTPSANEFPFGFMQLGPWDENDMNLFPTIRWHQTADYGLVPNDRLKVKILSKRINVKASHKKGHLSIQSLPCLISIEICLDST